MDHARDHGVTSGCLWIAALALLGWLGMGVSGVHGVPVPDSGTAPVAAVLDTTPPAELAVEGGPNEGGWYREPTELTWTARDADSGIAWCQKGSVTAAESATPRTVYGTCANGTGLTAPYVRFSYRFDGTPPRLDPVVRPDTVTRGGLVVAEPGGADTLSGVARQSCNGGRRLSTRRLGLHTVTCYVRDRAGNLATAQVRYLVLDPRQRRS